MSQPTNLGPCCICEKSGDSVRNIISLHQKTPTPGRGWGCVVCRLPSDGALAVLCDRCFDLFCGGGNELKFACCGYPGIDGRIPVGELTGVHEHDMKFHDGEE